MKIRQFISVMTCFFILSTSQAQFLKKLKKTAENAVERTILNRTDREVSKGTDKTIDSITQGKKGNESEKYKGTTSKNIGETEKNSGKHTSEEEKKAKEQKIMSMFGGGLEGIPETYDFTYLMEMTIESNKDKMKMPYYLKPDADYFGNSMEENPGSFIVYDLKNKAMVTFMDNGQQKMAMKMNMKLSDKMQKKINQKLNSAEGKKEEFQITPIEGKTILGYKCDGYQVITKEGTSKFWITDEAPVSMADVFSNQKSMPNSLQSMSLPFTNKTSILEMDFESNKKKKDNVHMLCTKLIKNQLTIVKSEYQSGY